jgi:rod shape-determining protein MreC
MASSRNRRPGFSRRAQYGLFLGYVIAVSGVVVGAVLLAVSTFNPPAFSAFRSGVAEVTAPVSGALSTVFGGIVSVPMGIGDYIAVGGENKRLRKQLADSNALLMRARTLSYDNHRLRRLLQVREGSADPVTVARLVNSSASSTRRYATLNAGSRQNVAVGQPVRGPDGLIGRVMETGPDTSRILLLTDPESIVPVRRTRDGLPAIAAGRGDGWIEIRSVGLVNAPFKAGDVFVTSGTGGIFAPNIPVAKAVSSARDAALARTYAQPDTLDYALVQKAFSDLPAPAPAADHAR